ncbi:membrane protein [Candidatus Thiomargarita nelsonii]|uniref:Membrane protein n=1 Tax=Candidatus Thiomargarita nelsonii TaxID=1003181 RepID=A0A176S1I8_9GAMM|nr:membrane protein [Candidatus Thiomargarita nelsonii]
MFAIVQYKILKDVSSTPRTFDNYLVMSAIVGGMFYLLLGIAAIGILFNETVGGLLLLGAMIYLIPYGLKTSKRFWEISYGKIFLYSFLSSIAATIAILCFVVLLYVVFDIEPVINGGETRGATSETQNLPPPVTEINGSVKVSWFLGGYQYVGILNLFGTYGTMRTTYFNPTTYMNEVVDQDMHLQSYQNEMFLVGSNPKVGGTNIPALYSPDTFRLKRLPDGSLTISDMCDQNGVCALVQVEVLR